MGRRSAGAARKRPVTVHLPAAAWRRREPAFEGTSAKVVVDSAIGGADLYGGVIDLEPRAIVPLHWHRRGELQYVLAGRGVLLHPDGTEARVSAGSAIFSPAGRSGAHGFRNPGTSRLSILFFYRAVGGRRPRLYLIGR